VSWARFALNRKHPRPFLSDSQPSTSTLNQQKSCGRSHVGDWPQPLSSNIRLIATMRSRSKKGEVGPCCAQPCYRPGPIVIMVLPTEIQPDSLIRIYGSDRRSDRHRVSLSNPCARRLKEIKRRALGSETIHHNSSLQKPCGQFFASTGTRKSGSKRCAKCIADRIVQTSCHSRWQ
jgi:hypothetical protein